MLSFFIRVSLSLNPGRREDLSDASSVIPSSDEFAHSVVRGESPGLQALLDREMEPNYDFDISGGVGADVEMPPIDFQPELPDIDFDVDIAHASGAGRREGSVSSEFSEALRSPVQQFDDDGFAIPLPPAAAARLAIARKRAVEVNKETELSDKQMRLQIIDTSDTWTSTSFRLSTVES
jgi:hypothetical protein